METKEYRGQILRLTYPAFLRIKAEEPDWYGASSKPFAHALVMVDPPHMSVDNLERQILDPHLKGHPGSLDVTIVQEGDFQTMKGISGCHRVIKVVNAVSQISWSWHVGAKIRGSHIVTMHISANDNAWHNGTLWKSFLDSIEILSVDQVGVLRRRRIDAELAKGKRKVARVKAGVRKKPRDLGVLAHLPLELTYLIEPALVVGSLPVHELEDNPAVIEAIEESLKKEMRGLTKAAATIRIKVDREKLWEWLQQYPAEKHPETLGLYGVYGALLYADGMAFTV